mmetsp:Transcript_137473/g.439242  ORF Transcript_137473/g.439242 Transcript_137473/m.439242 type:complete len:469 (+) Transcript_137473:3706-5112(+)
MCIQPLHLLHSIPGLFGLLPQLVQHQSATTSPRSRAAVRVPRGAADEAAQRRGAPVDGAEREERRGHRAAPLRGIQEPRQLLPQCRASRATGNRLPLARRRRDPDGARDLLGHRPLHAVQLLERGRARGAVAQSLHERLLNPRLQALCGARPPGRRAEGSEVFDRDGGEHAEGLQGGLDAGSSRHVVFLHGVPHQHRHATRPQGRTPGLGRGDGGRGQGNQQRLQLLARCVRRLVEVRQGAMHQAHRARPEHEGEQSCLQGSVGACPAAVHVQDPAGILGAEEVAARRVRRAGGPDIELPLLRGREGQDPQQRGLPAAKRPVRAQTRQHLPCHVRRASQLVEDVEEGDRPQLASAAWPRRYPKNQRQRRPQSAVGHRETDALLADRGKEQREEEVLRRDLRQHPRQRRVRIGGRGEQVDGASEALPTSQEVLQIRLQSSRQATTNSRQDLRPQHLGRELLEAEARGKT